MDRLLTLVALLVFCLDRLTLTGMGRHVGGEWMLTAFTWVCLFGWPLALTRASAGWRALAYLTAPALYAGLGFWMVHHAPHAREPSGHWGNAFAELQVFVQFAKGILLTGVTAGVLETLHRRAARGTAADGERRRVDPGRTMRGESPGSRVH